MSSPYLVRKTWRNVIEGPNTWKDLKTNLTTWVNPISFCAKPSRQKSKILALQPFLYCHLAKQKIFVQRTSCGLRASQPTCAKIKPFAMCSSAKQVKHSTCIGRSPAHGAEPAWKWFTRNWSRRLYHCCLSDTPHLHNCKMRRPYRCSMLGANMNRMKPPEKLVEELNLKPCPHESARFWSYAGIIVCKNNNLEMRRPCRNLQPRGPYSQTPLWKPCPTWWNPWFCHQKWMLFWTNTPVVCHGSKPGWRTCRT